MKSMYSALPSIDGLPTLGIASSRFESDPSRIPDLQTAFDAGHELANHTRTHADLTDITIESGTDKAIQSYQKFLEQTPEAAMTPEALRRLADLKIQREYGTLEGVTRNERKSPPPAEPRPCTMDAALSGMK